jgi:hypothetical protein
MTFGIMTLSIECRCAECRGLLECYPVCRYAECRYADAECRYGECRGATLISSKVFFFLNNCLLRLQELATVVMKQLRARTNLTKSYLLLIYRTE